MTVNCDVYQRYGISRRIILPWGSGMRRDHCTRNSCRSSFDTEAGRSETRDGVLSWQICIQPWISRERIEALPIVCGMNVLSTTIDRIFEGLVLPVILCYWKPVRSSSQSLVIRGPIGFKRIYPVRAQEQRPTVLCNVSQKRLTEVTRSRMQGVGALVTKIFITSCVCPCLRRLYALPSITENGRHHASSLCPLSRNHICATWLNHRFS
jgi:hypothetical protein